LVRKFFQGFKQVRFLNEEKSGTWQEIAKITPELPKGWFELSRIGALDRISFVRDLWQKVLPFHPGAHEKISEFFSRLDDIGIVLVKKREQDPFSAELIYSLHDNRSFFRGLVPANGDLIRESTEGFETLLPQDYRSFLTLHNGFGKLSSLGLFPCENLIEMKQRVLEMLLEADRPIQSGNRVVDPDSLIPFYEEEGLFSFQCFYADWYPGSEMGNVYLSGIDYTMSDTDDWRGWRENLAFPTFMEWLGEYLGGMNLSF
jgi:hypothetical protein